MKGKGNKVSKERLLKRLKLSLNGFKGSQYEQCTRRITSLEEELKHM